MIGKRVVIKSVARMAARSLFRKTKNSIVVETTENELVVRLPNPKILIDKWNSLMVDMEFAKTEFTRAAKREAL